MLYIPDSIPEHLQTPVDGSISFLLYHECILNETYHVIDEMSDVSENIFNTIIEHIANLSDKNIEDKILNNSGQEIYYTGYNIRNFLEIPKETIKPLFIVRCDNEKLYVPIYFSFDKRAFMDSNDLSSVTLRLIWYPNKNKDVPLSTFLIRSEDTSQDKAVIYINLMKFLQKRDDEELVPYTECATWIAVISHELHHLLESFINKDDNLTLHKPNSLFAFFKFDRDINKDVSSQYYNTAEVILYCLSPEEQRARSTLSETILNYFLNDSDYRCQIFNLYKKQVQKRSEFRIDDEDRMMTIVLMSHSLMKFIHNIPNFYKALTYISYERNADVENQARSIILVGYYLNIYKLLKDKTPEVDKLLTQRNVNLILRADDLRWIDTDEYKSVSKIIVKNIIRLYYEYEHMMFLRYYRHAKDFLDKLGILVDDKKRLKLIGINYEYLTKKEHSLIESVRRNVEYMLTPKHMPIKLSDGTLVMS